jgi:hypothetical protein
MLSCIPIGWISSDLIFTKYHQTFAPTAKDKEHTTGATSLSSCASASGKLATHLPQSSARNAAQCFVFFEFLLPIRNRFLLRKVNASAPPP